MPVGDNPADGRPKYSSTMITSGGSERNRSTMKMISQFSGRTPS